MNNKKLFCSRDGMGQGQLNSCVQARGEKLSTLTSERGGRRSAGALSVPVHPAVVLVLVLVLMLVLVLLVLVLLVVVVVLPGGGGRALHLLDGDDRGLVVGGGGEAAAVHGLSSQRSHLWKGSAINP